MSNGNYISEHLFMLKKYDEMDRINEKFHKLMAELTEVINNSHSERANQIGLELVKLVKKQSKMIELLVSK